MKITRKGKNIFPELKRYSKIINETPGVKTVTIYSFDTKEEAVAKADKLRSWKKFTVAQARTERGYFAKGYVLICCK